MRLATGVLLWVAAAAAATAVGLAAVAAIGTDIFGAGEDPLSESQVDQLLASRTTAPSPPPPTTSSPTPTTSSSPPATSSPPPAGEQKKTVTEAGVVISRCAANGLVEVLSAVPAQGYSVDGDDDELDDHPSIKFESGELEVEVRLRCVNGVPDPEIRRHD